MKGTNLLNISSLILLIALGGCQENSINQSADSKINAAPILEKSPTSNDHSEQEATEDAVESPKSNEVLKRAPILKPLIDWNKEVADTKLEPNEFTSLYCNKENSLNGVGSLQTITEVLDDNSWVSSNCTASIATFGGEEFLITAAHCVVDKEYNRMYPAEKMTFTVHHGCSDIESKWSSEIEKIYLSPGVQEYFIKEEFSIRADHDWAIIKLKSKSPDYINKYFLNFEGEENSNAGNFGFGGLQEPSGYPTVADGKTLIGYKQNIKKLHHNPILKLDSHTIVGMSGGPIFDLDSFEILGVNSHAIQKTKADGDWVYSKSSLGAYPQKSEVKAIVEQFGL